MSANDGGGGNGRRVRVAIGATALAALLGGSAYMITESRLKDDAESSTAGAVAAANVSAAPQATAYAEPSPGGSSSAPASQPSSSAKPIPPEVRKSIDAARKAMREHGVPVKRPVVPKVTPMADIETTTEGSLKSGGIVRVLAARGDLTGQRELAYVAGGISKYQGVPCSQTFQFSTNPTPSKRPNLLICWRVTNKKSVAAIVVDPKGHPSRAKAVGIIQQKWRSMG